MKIIILFDLDDTLYQEIDFLKSGYRKISALVEQRYGIAAEAVYSKMLEWYLRGEKDVFGLMNEHFGLDNPIIDYLNIYRYHKPDISLSASVYDTLSELSRNCVLGIISDGRKVNQWNKIKALGLMEFIDEENVIISEDFGYEKPSEANYKYFMNRFPDCEYVYVGDNLQKDFIAPNALGWETICLLDNGQNIHSQDFNLPSSFLPHKYVRSLSELKNLI